MRKWNICLLITIILLVFSFNAVSADDSNSTDVYAGIVDDSADDSYAAVVYDANDSYSKYSDGDIIKENDNSVVNASGSFTKLFFAVKQVDNGGTVNLTGGILLYGSDTCDSRTNFTKLR